MNDMKKNKISEANFFTATRAHFHYSSEMPIEFNGLGWHFESPDGSKYMYTKEGVYRKSDHWMQVAFCFWSICPADPIIWLAPNRRFAAHNTIEMPPQKVVSVLGFCKWSDFEWQELDAEQVVRLKNKFRDNSEALREIEKQYGV